MQRLFLKTGGIAYDDRLLTIEEFLDETDPLPPSWVRDFRATMCRAAAQRARFATVFDEIVAPYDYEALNVPPVPLHPQLNWQHVGELPY